MSVVDRPGPEWSCKDTALCRVKTQRTSDFFPSSLYERVCDGKVIATMTQCTFNSLQCQHNFCIICQKFIKLSVAFWMRASLAPLLLVESLNHECFQMYKYELE